ncbi:MAG: hypothetical protein ABIK89_11770, partial [Planctomycetota bacterium]
MNCHAGRAMRRAFLPAWHVAVLGALLAPCAGLYGAEIERAADAPKPHPPEESRGLFQVEE